MKNINHDELRKEREKEALNVKEKHISKIIIVIVVKQLKKTEEKNAEIGKNKK